MTFLFNYEKDYTPVVFRFDCLEVRDGTSGQRTFSKTFSKTVVQLALMIMYIRQFYGYFSNLNTAFTWIKLSRTPVLKPNLKGCITTKKSLVTCPSANRPPAIRHTIKYMHTIITLLKTSMVQATITDVK